MGDNRAMGGRSNMQGLTRGIVVPLTAALLIAAATGSPGCAGAPAPKAPTTFSVMTYNVHYHMPGPDSTLAALRAADADIVCLQETTPAWEDRLRRGLADRYGHILFRHMGGAGGLGVLSKWPVREQVYHQCSGTWHPGWLIEVDTPGGPLAIFNLHLHPPKARGADGVWRAGIRGYFESKPIRRRQIEELLGKIDADCRPLIVGDFNEAESAKAVTYACRTRGLRSALAEFDPSASTWHSRDTLIPLRARLDHLLYPDTLRCLDARVLRQGGSDHYPVVGTFDFVR
jgi:endonuclease/exonuclease/phosphatase family metal-dependent hydrolase